MTTRCEVCHRRLTDPESIARGIGPVCLKKVEGQGRSEPQKQVVLGVA